MYMRYIAEYIWLDSESKLGPKQKLLLMTKQNMNLKEMISLKIFQYGIMMAVQPDKRKDFILNYI